MQRPAPYFALFRRPVTIDLIRWARYAMTLPQLWLRRARDREELSQLSADQLRDVGLSERMVRREAEKPFWLE